MNLDEKIMTLSLTHHFLKSPFNPHQTLTVSFVTAWAWVPSISNELPLRKWCVKRRQTMRRERGAGWSTRCLTTESWNVMLTCGCFALLFFAMFFFLSSCLFYFILSFCLLGPIFYPFCLNFLKNNFNIMYIYIHSFWMFMVSLWTLLSTSGFNNT